MRYGIIIIYCVLLAFGTYWILKRNGVETLAFVANRDLPVNRLLQPGDIIPARWYANIRQLGIAALEESDFVGRYMKGDVRQGALLRSDSTNAVLHLATQPARVLLIANLLRTKLENVNADTCIRLAGVKADPIKVRAVLCPSEPQANCAAVVELPVAQLTNLAAVLGNNSLSVSDPVPCS